MFYPGPKFSQTCILSKTKASHFNIRPNLYLVYNLLGHALHLWDSSESSVSRSHSNSEGLQPCHCRVHFCMLCYYPHFLYLSFNTAIKSSARQMGAGLSPAISEETLTMHFARCKSMWEQDNYFQPGACHMLESMLSKNSRMF